MVPFAICTSASHVHEIDQGHHKHPHNVDELPKQAAVLKVNGSVAAALVAHSDDYESNECGDYVQQLDTSDAVVGATKEPSAPRVFVEGDALADHAEPFADVQGHENETHDQGNHGKAKSFIASLSTRSAHCQHHGQTAGDHDEGHDHDADDGAGLIRPRPVRLGIPKKSVSDQTSGKGHDVGNNE